MRNFDCVIFDIDGTLVSTIQLIFDSFNFVAEKYSNKRYTDNEIIEMFGPTEEYLLKELFGSNFRNAEADYFEYYKKMHSEKAVVFPGMEAILTDLKSRGISLGVFTGKGRRSTDITLSELGYIKFFDITITGDDVINCKPSGEGITKIIKHFNVDKSKTIMIGDSAHDVIASKEAGVKIVSVLWDSFAVDEIKKLNPDYICPDVNSLKLFLQKNT